MPNYFFFIRIKSLRYLRNHIVLSSFLQSENKTHHLINVQKVLFINLVIQRGKKITKFLFTILFKELFKVYFMRRAVSHTLCISLSSNVLSHCDD